MKVIRNRVWQFLTRERSARFRLLSFLVVIVWGLSLVQFVTGDVRVLVVATGFYFGPVSVVIIGFIYHESDKSMFWLRTLSFGGVITACLFLVTIFLYGLHTRSVLPDSLILLFLVNVLVIALSCARPPVQQTIELIRENKLAWLLYLLCAERVMVWPVTCAVLVLSDIALGVGGEIQLFMAEVGLLFFVGFSMHVRETLQKLRANTV